MNEINFDGLVGPTHNYAGLSYGNVASINNAGTKSNPRLAAMQGLDKMRLLMELGVAQYIIPPHQRPNFALLHNLGFHGTPIQMLQQAQRVNPALLATVYSAASMWTANMATISPSCDTVDGKVHITPANLTFNLHRAQEAEFSFKLLQAIFKNDKHFQVHAPLPAYRDLSDEGAANHSVLCQDYGKQGLELFIYGRYGLDEANNQQLHFPARQSKLASLAISQQHQLKATATMLLQQNPRAINAGAFHNDVVFVANKNVMFYHEHAILDWVDHKPAIEKYFGNQCYFLEVTEQRLPLSDAINTYLFNSQLISVDTKNMILIAPSECKESSQAEAVIDSIITADNPISGVRYVACRQSMRNGGGPACLRLRAILSVEQEAALPTKLRLTPDLYQSLSAWIERHYRDSLSADDLLDPKLYLEVQQALDALTKILDLGSIYPFQQI